MHFGVVGFSKTRAPTAYQTASAVIIPLRGLLSHANQDRRASNPVPEPRLQVALRRERSALARRSKEGSQEARIPHSVLPGSRLSHSLSQRQCQVSLAAV